MQRIAPARPDGRHIVDRLAVRDMLPVIVSIAPFGMLVGVATGALATHPAGALFGSLLIYGGSAQLAATTLLDAGGGLLAILGSVIVIQSRLLVYGAGLEPLFRDQPALFRWLAPATIVDQTYASALARQDEFGTATRFRRYWWSAGGVLGLGWLAAIGAGMALGPVLPPSSPMSIAVPAVFVGLLVPRLTGRPAAAAALAGAVTAAAAAALPNGLGLLLGVAAGAAAGALVQAWRRPHAHGAAVAVGEGQQPAMAPAAHPATLPAAPHSSGREETAMDPMIATALHPWNSRRRHRSSRPASRRMRRATSTLIRLHR